MDDVVNLDKLTYAGNLDTLAEVDGNSRYVFVKGDICDTSLVRSLLKTYRPGAIMHLAAETHVDRSIDGPSDFISTNIIGTYSLLNAALYHYECLSAESRESFRFHHISTDEVFGSLGVDGTFSELTAYDPRSPYSASKAASDHLVSAWGHTYGLPVVLSNCSNNFGPFQFPEKLIPLMIVNALNGNPLPVYGEGTNVRDWLYVEEHALALMAILRRGRNGQIYLVSGDAEMRNIDVVHEVCSLLDELAPDSPYRPHAELISLVEDRPGHDYRYAIDSSKIQKELGWQPRISFETGLRRTVNWYLANRSWWEPLYNDRLGRERLGLRGMDKL